MDKRSLTFRTLLVVAIVASAIARYYRTHERGDEAPHDDAWPRVGQWHVAEPNKGDPDEAARLLALGYAEGSQTAPAVTGVTRYNRERAADGVNLFVSGHASEAYLLDMNGALLHTWSYPRERAFPNLGALVADADADRLYWRYVWPRKDGSVIAVYEGAGLVALDAKSQPLWTHQGFNHHDIDVDAAGAIYALGRSRRVVPWFRATPVIDDAIQILSPDGRPLQQISILDALEGTPHAKLLERAPTNDDDVLHTNAVRALDGAFKGWSALKKGRILVSIRELDALVVIDRVSAKAVWSLTGVWRRQHAPELLANGRLLLFDNVGAGERSRLLELDARGGTPWTYDGGPTPFVSKTCGAAQRLLNGNTLVAESEAGRAFEIDANGELVWEFVNPHRTGTSKQLIAAVFEMTRLPKSFAEPLTQKVAPAH